MSGKVDPTDAENLEAYVTAGLKATYSKERKKEDFTPGDVECWMGDLSNTQVSELEKSIVALITSDAPGE